MSILQRFRNMGEAVFPLEIIPSPEGEKPYFCTPAHADTFARLGVDGIHFCIVPHAGCSEDECPVMVVSPESEEYVYTIALRVRGQSKRPLCVTVPDSRAI